ncbi:hypothetical protein DSC45_01560 [Streptomyces sp. YIM 130001]|uniref:hypothetical protein n=1 Tax=Streptomyces sp. YIM 130001 TaxID=2259644 RepID=UPI000ECD3C29|nr:hypothetical protein [Streptomyces sp. YIM 130001]RII21078.1 hypothetical protein DSC45_01560 [Streptomyces sp. YIM 130001]
MTKRNQGPVAAAAAAQGRAAGGMTAYDRRMYALMNRNEMASVHGSAARRRAVVIAHLVLTAAMAGAFVVSMAMESRWVLVALLVLLVPWCVATGMINSATRGLLELRARALDERQLAERDRAMARAHRLSTAVAGAAFVAAAAATRFGDVDAGVLLLPALGLVLVAHWLMPLWVAGLSVADEPVDELDT